MQIVIIAGGKGTRLRERIGDLPKPLAPIGERPLLEHHILLGKRHGCSDFVLLTGYGAQAIREFCGDGTRWGVSIRYVEEPAPLGTAGAVLAALPLLADRFVIAYGDTMASVDLTRFYRAHENSGVAATLFLHPNDHPQDSDLVEIDSAGRITAFHPYPHPEGSFYRNLVNAALYVIDRSALVPWQGRTELPDFGKHLFPAMLSAGVPLQGYVSPEYIKDAGTPERLDKVEAAYASGLIERVSLEQPAPAVFLDRDGTLNREVNRISDPASLELLDGVPEAVALLNRSGYRAVVISNQPVIARGDCDEATLRLIHNKLETLLGQEHAWLDAIYYCPHHPDKGFAGERPELKIECNCRKPRTGLIDEAVRDLNIDISGSWMIGDTTVDVRTAREAGIRSVLLRTGHAGQDGRYPDQPDYQFPDLLEAVRFIVTQ